MRGRSLRFPILARSQPLVMLLDDVIRGALELG